MARKLQPVAEGGTGATTAADARTNLAINSAAEEALRDGYIVETATSPATPPSGRQVLYYRYSDRLLLRKDSSGALRFVDQIIQYSATLAALTAAADPVTHVDKWGIVTGTTSTSGFYRSNGAIWDLIIGQNFYTKSEVDNLDEFTRTGGKIQPKDAYAGEEFRIGLASTAYLINSAGAGAGKFTGTTSRNAQVAGWQTSNDTTLSDGHTLTSATNEWSGLYEAWKAFDNNASTPWTTDANSPQTLTIEFPTPRVVNSYEMAGGSLATRSPGYFNLRGWNGSSWDTLDTRGDVTLESFGTGTSPIYQIANPGAYAKYSLEVIKPQNGGANGSVGIVSLSLFEADVTTAYVYSGTDIAFAPGTLEIKQGASAIGDNAGLVTLDYSIDSGAYTGTYITLAAFKALDPTIFAAVGDLKIRVKHTGINPLTSLSMSTTSSAIIFSPNGSIRADINGIAVWETTAAGDQTSVDMNVESLTSTGPVEGTTVKATTAIQVVETVGAPAAVAGSGKFYTASDNIPMFQDGDGTAHQLLTADQAANGVTKSRHYVATTDDSWVTIATIAIAADTAVRLKAQIVGIKTNGAAVAMYGKAALVTRVGVNAPVVVGVVNDSDVESATAGNYTTAAAYDAQIDISSNNAIVQVRGGAATTDVKWVAQIEQFSVNTATGA